MNPKDAARPPRLLSLDAFRGAVVACMILVNNASGTTLPFLRHAQWHGLTLADAVFPSFVFIIGVSMALSARRDTGTWGQRLSRFLIRVVVLFGLGLLINVVYALEAGTGRVGVTGVLQRIALASLLAFPFTRLRSRGMVAAGLAMLAVYSVLLLWMPFPGGHAGELSHPGATLPAYVDRVLAGGGSTLDPENLLGTIPTAGGMLLGAAAGCAVLDRSRRVWLSLLASGALALVAGVALSPWMPVNKRLWTATFVLVVTGIDLILLAVTYRVVDVGGRHRVARAFEPLGRNALLLYVGSTLLSGLLLLAHAGGGKLYVVLAAALAASLGSVVGPIVFAAAHLALWWAVAIVLYRRRIFVRL